MRGDCRDVLKTIASESVHSIVTDPPYELGFMGKSWDSTGIAYDVGMWRECLRMLKPGGHLLAFGGSRTYHRLACAIEDAGFEVRDQIMWLYGSGFPKSKNLDGEWKGWGTTLKPAHEPIVVARKPLAGSVTANVQTHGCGALNIDASRVGDEMRVNAPAGQSTNTSVSIGKGWREDARPITVVGRWPANVIHDGSDEVFAAFPEAPGQQGDLRDQDHAVPAGNAFGQYGPRRAHVARRDSGSAARFFYCAKASKKERGEGNNHPTVKPLALMRYLIRLVTPPGGVVVDPFMGSGTAGVAALNEGFDFIGIEQEKEYLDIAKQRLSELNPGVKVA